MSASSAWSLQEAIHARLTSDAALTALLGGPRIYDHVPHATRAPYVTFGPSVVRDWSTGTEDGEEHVVTLHVWTEVGGRKVSDAIVAALRAALHDSELFLIDHRLVSLRQEATETRRESDGDTFRAAVRLRAVTEPL
jgi:hypothetical protein